MLEYLSSEADLKNAITYLIYEQKHVLCLEIWTFTSNLKRVFKVIATQNHKQTTSTIIKNI